MITVLSLGAGVQSSTLALMAAKGDITPMPDVAVFADTGYEPKAVYSYLEWLKTQLPYPIVTVSKGNLKEDHLASRLHTGDRVAALPTFIQKDDAEVVLNLRQCTAEYKIAPLTKYIRETLLQLKPRQRAPKTHVVDQWFGISYDEIQRMKVPFVEPWRRNVYPLVEKHIRRGQCLEWMAKHNYPEPPRSACLCCPFHSEEEWLKIKSGDQEEWQDVIEFDQAIRSSNGIRGKEFLHRTCKPINEVDFFTLENAGQMSLLDECEGYCGV